LGNFYGGGERAYILQNNKGAVAPLALPIYANISNYSIMPFNSYNEWAHSTLPP